MKVFIYLSFTLMSIFFRFCIMDILQNNKSDVTSQEKNVLKEIFEKSHALYYKIDLNASVSTPKYSNVSLPIDPFLDKYFSTPTPMYDVLFDESSTASEMTEPEQPYSTTEYANMTDLDLFPKVSTTTPKPMIKPKKLEHRDNCFCDLSYHSCDVNCCCDEECSVLDRQLFGTCLQENWSSHQYNMCNNTNIFSIRGLICSSKSNVPEKRNVVSFAKEHINVDSVILNMFSWTEREQRDEIHNFLGKQYTQDEPIWMFHENIITSIDLPTPYVNNYCTDRKPMKFLRNENYQCLIKLKSLESLRIYGYISSSQVISVPVDNWEINTANCSNLLCTKWNVVVCDQESCENYNKTIHEPECTDNLCKNIALRVEYVFQCNASNITNAIVRLYTQDIELNNQYFNQEIKVTFYLGTENATENIVHFSGNPGYVNNLPVIASLDTGNHTDGILNNNKTYLKIIRYPDNVNGACLLSNTTYKIVQFQENIRSKCFYKYNKKSNKNATATCKAIQSEIYSILDANSKKYISPLGNPLKLVDKDWIEIKQEISGVGVLHGEYDSDNNTVICNNLATKLSYVFTFADIGDDVKSNYKIFDAKCTLKSDNRIHRSTENTAVLTVDISFLDVSKQPVYEFAGPPQLNIHLPEDFFYPFTQNYGNTVKECSLTLLVTMCVFIMRNKINNS